MKKLATLGPSGTSSDYVAHECMKKLYSEEFEITLFSTFEEAAEELLEDKVDLLLVPHAYKNINVFYMHPLLKIEKVFIHDTPMYGIATRNNIEDIQYDNIISHEAPIPMIKHYLLPEIKIDLANSTSVAAELVSNGTYDFCITNEMACKKYGLKFIKFFHQINMSWSIFKRKKDNFDE